MLRNPLKLNSVPFVPERTYSQMAKNHANEPLCTGYRGEVPSWWGFQQLISFSRFFAHSAAYLYCRFPRNSNLSTPKRHVKASKGVCPYARTSNRSKSLCGVPLHTYYVTYVDDVQSVDMSDKTDRRTKIDLSVAASTLKSRPNRALRNERIP